MKTYTVNEFKTLRGLLLSYYVTYGAAETIDKAYNDVKAVMELAKLAPEDEKHVICFLSDGSDLDVFTEYCLTKSEAALQKLDGYHHRWTSDLAL